LDDSAIRDIQTERLGLDQRPVEFEAVREARVRHAERQALDDGSAVSEAQRLSLLAQDAADAAAAAAAALAAAQDAMRRAGMTSAARPLAERA
jgi:hypothetical protein